MQIHITKKLVYKVIRLILLIIIIVLIYNMFKKIDINFVFTTFKNTNKHILLTLVALQIFTQLLISYQWYRLVNKLNYTGRFHQMFLANSYGNFYDSITPGSKVGGEFRKVFFLTNELNYNIHQSTTLVSIQKSFSFFALLALSGIAFIILSLNINFLHNIVYRLSLIAMFIIMSYLVFQVLFNSKNLSDKLNKKNLQSTVGKKITVWISELANSMQLLKSNRFEILVQLIISLAIWILYPLKMYILISQYADISIILVFPVVFISYFTGMLPITPGGLGTFEGTMSNLFELANIEFSIAVTISVIFRFITFWFVFFLSSIVILFWKLLNIKHSFK